MSRTDSSNLSDNNPMEQETIDIVRKNASTLIGLRGFETLNSFAKHARMDYKTISNLLADDFISNPTLKVVHKLAKSLKVEPWMLLVKDFPFDQVKSRPLKSLSGLTYVVANAMEQETDTVKLLMMESASHVLRGVDAKQSDQIKEAQTAYLKKEVLK